MSTPSLPSTDAPIGAPGPQVPPGWLANWSPEHNAWYYVYTATGATQWDYPTAPSAQPQLSPPPDREMPPFDQSPYTPGPDGADVPPQDGDRGLGKAALAMGGGFLAGSTLGRLVGGHNNHEHHHHGFGNITQSLAAAGAAGAIGSKLFGLFKDKPQPQQQQQPPTPQTQVHVYPVYMPSPQASPMSPPPPMSPPQPYYGGPAVGSPPSGYFPAAGTNLGPGTPNPPPTPYSGGVQSPAMGGMGGFAPQMGPPLYIHGAVFADRDVTQMVRGLVTPHQSLTLQGENLVEQFGDPWPEVKRKMFNVLYSYGDRPMELVAADTSTANIEIKHEAISKKRMEFCKPPPSRIIACVWGFENPLTVSRLEQLETNGEMDGSQQAFGGGGFYDWEPKTLVCYYRTETGGIGIVYCRDGGTIRLPWNPLAKWS